MNYIELSLGELEELYDKANKGIRDARSIRERKQMEFKLDEIDKVIYSKLPVQKYEGFSDKELNDFIDEYEKHNDWQNQDLDRKAMYAVHKNRLMKRLFSEDNLNRQEELDKSILLSRITNVFYITKVIYSTLCKKDLLTLEDFYNYAKEFGQKEASEKFNIPYKLNEREKIEEVRARLMSQGYDIVKTQELNEDIYFLEQNGYIVK